MNLMNCSVKHISWGIGTVTEQKDNYIKIISLGLRKMKFVYPDAFEKFLKCEDTNMQSQIEEELVLKNSRKSRNNRNGSRKLKKSLVQFGCITAIEKRKTIRKETSLSTQITMAAMRKRPNGWIFMCLQ